MPAMPPEELESVFGGKGAEDADAALDPELDEEGDGAEASEALDAAIDEAFDSEDPIARREAFKNAVRLCGEADY
jgi:hypothetical protein